MRRPIPLFDYRGKIRLWFGSPNWIVDMSGMPAAYVELSSIYSVCGLHLAWWEEYSVLAHDGSVLLVSRAGNPWVQEPVYQANRPALFVRPMPPRPVLGRVPAKYATHRHWVSPDSLLDQITVEQMAKRNGMFAARSNVRK